jgi:hypothetical protein
MGLKQQICVKALIFATQLASYEARQEANIRIGYGPANWKCYATNHNFTFHSREVGQ